MSNYIVNNDTVDVLSENCITILKNLPAKNLYNKYRSSGTNIPKRT